MATNTPAQEYFGRAEELFNSGSYNDAARYFRRAWQLDPTLERAVLYIANCYLGLGSPFTAYQFLWEALLRNQTNHLVWMQTGDAYFRFGRPELTIRFYEYALRLNPTNPELKQIVQSLPATMSSMQRYFEEQLVSDQWTSPLDHQRTTAFLADFRNISEASWTRLCLFYREYLNPKRFQKLDLLLHDSRFAEMRASHPDRFQGQEMFLDRIRLKIAPLEKCAGPPLKYRFDAADGAPLLKAAAIRMEILERKKLIEDTSQQNDSIDLARLRLRGLQLLEAFLGKIGDDQPANFLMESFKFALSNALAALDFEAAQALAFGEMELTMCFAQPGLTESETLPSGEGISEGAERMDPDVTTEAVKLFQNAATPEEAVREVKSRGAHVESIFNVLSVMGPHMYLLYAVDYSKAYDLSKKMVLLSDLLPERLRRFPLRAFYRLQGLASLAEASAKLGLHEETIRAGTRLEATVKEMGADWRDDLPQFPATIMRLGQAELPEQVLERAYNLMAGAYRSLGDPIGVNSTSAKISQLGSIPLIGRGHVTASDCLAFMEELRHTDDGLDSAFKYAYMALSLDERKYRQADVQFYANRVLAEMVGELGLPRLEIIHWLHAFAAAVEMNIPFNILLSLHSLGRALEQHNEVAGAEYFYRKAVRRIEAQSPLEQSMLTTLPAIASLFRLAILVEHGAPNEARMLLERAIGVIETQREAMQEDLNAAGFGRAGSDIYAELIDLNLDILEDNKAAFEVLERSKMRALLDQFAKRASSEHLAHPPSRFEDICNALVVP